MANSKTTPGSRSWSWLLNVTIVVALSLTLSDTLHAGDRIAKRPNQAQLTGFVKQQFGKVDGHQAGDLVTQSKAKKVLVALNKKGWTVKDPNALMARLLPDNHFLAKQLSDERGRDFLRKVENLPGGIDRLDRMTQMPQGEANVNDLIRKVPNGADWIRAMTTTRRGERLGQRLSKSDAGQDFNEPTGRIYQLNEFVAALLSDLVPAKAPFTTNFK